jgi:hypothetical protein
MIYSFLFLAFGHILISCRSLDLNVGFKSSDILPSARSAVNEKKYMIEQQNASL